MEFSNNFLNKLLNSAIKYHKTDNKGESIPEKLTNIDSAIKRFSNALIFEAHKSMQNEIISDKIPILHAVNLDGNNPGIISGKSNCKNKYLVHKKTKIKKKKTKTPEQIEKEIKKANERLQERKLKKEAKDKEKEELKKEKNDIKENKKEVTELKKQINNSQKIMKKIKLKAEKNNEKIQKKENPTQEDLNYAKELNDQADEYVKNYLNLLKQKEDKEENIESRSNKIKENQDLKKQERLKKAEERKKKREEKNLLAKKKKEEKEKEIAEKIDENDMNLYDELFDLIIESQKIKDSEINNNTVVSLDNIKLYESPLPYQRHISALENCKPNKILIPALLNGYKINDKDDGFINLYHGPPGTGKTYRLMQELLKIINDKKHEKILVCAPSNIATINMYYRAKKLNIKCSLVISSSKMPDNIDDNDIFGDKVIFSTISMRFGSKLRDMEFTTIMMDEAAQCQEAWVWGLLRPELKYIYLAGDPHQLPALVSEEGVNFNHGRSIMERMISLGYPSELLDTQRRMHPDIVAFSNKMYYNNKLKTSYTKIKGNNIKPFQIININGNETRIGTSYQNKDEADKVIQLYDELKKKFDEVIVISPYQAQCSLLKKINKNIEIHTVDSFQGREADAVILTTVRTNNMGFWYDYRRLNVAMTRAKHALRIIGNTQSWNKGPLNDLIKFYND
jgi:hypothetical protein